MTSGHRSTPAAGESTHKSICRFCHAYCGIEVDIADNHVVAVRGDRDHAVSQGSESPGHRDDRMVGDDVDDVMQPAYVPAFKGW